MAPEEQLEIVPPRGIARIGTQSLGLMTRGAVRLEQGGAHRIRRGLRRRRGLDGWAGRATHQPREDAGAGEQDTREQKRRVSYRDLSHGYTRLKCSLSMDDDGTPASSSIASTAFIIGGGPHTK